VAKVNPCGVLGRLLFAWSLFPAVGLAGARGEDVTARLRSQVDSAIAKMKPALVRIHVVSAEYNEGREVKMQAVGSGAIITKDGYLITNHHVAGHGIRMFCTLWNREEVEAELVGTDPLTRNRYGYVNGDPVDNFDPSGHYLAYAATGMSGAYSGNADSALPDSNQSKPLSFLKPATDWIGHGLARVVEPR